MDRSDSAAEMLLEKLERQRKRALRLRLRVGLAAVAREGMIGAGIFVNGHEGIGREPPFQQLVNFRLHPAVFERHVSTNGRWRSLASRMWCSIYVP